MSTNKIFRVSEPSSLKNPNYWNQNRKTFFAADSTNPPKWFLKIWKPNLINIWANIDHVEEEVSIVTSAEDPPGHASQQGIHRLLAQSGATLVFLLFKTDCFKY